MRVALVGADGSGKSTISRMLETAPLPAPVKRIYMGVNLDASSLMLPTTRLLVAAKRARGGPPDLVGMAPDSARTGGPRTWRRSARGTARMMVWILEEWLRQAVAWRYSRAGYLVVFDRHFLADYYHSDIEPRSERRGAISALHGWMLQHAYPKPDLVICLDAPGSVLFARKPESSQEWVEQRRRQYLRLADALPAFVVVDADRPLDEVFTDVVDAICDLWEATAA
jgi:thymidylate kinase